MLITMDYMDDGEKPWNAPNCVKIQHISPWSETSSTLHYVF